MSIASVTHFFITCTDCFVSDRKVTDLFWIMKYFFLIYQNNYAVSPRAPAERFSHTGSCKFTDMEFKLKKTRSIAGYYTQK